MSQCRWCSTCFDDQYIGPLWPEQVTSNPSMKVPRRLVVNVRCEKKRCAVQAASTRQVNAHNNLGTAARRHGLASVATGEARRTGTPERLAHNDKQSDMNIAMAS